MWCTDVCMCMHHYNTTNPPTPTPLQHHNHPTTYIGHCIPPHKHQPPLLHQQVPHWVIGKLVYVLRVHIHEGAIKTHGGVVITVHFEVPEGVC